MIHLYEAPLAEITPEFDAPDVIRKRKFWKRAIWISIICVIIPPIFGVAGTVIGIVNAFETLAETSDADPKALAEDVSVALLTTMYGLIVSTIAFLVLVGVFIRFLKLPKTLMPEVHQSRE